MSKQQNVNRKKNSPNDSNVIPARSLVPNMVAKNDSLLVSIEVVNNKIKTIVSRRYKSYVCVILLQLII